MKDSDLLALERRAKLAGGMIGGDETPWVTTADLNRPDLFCVLTEPGGAALAELVPRDMARFIAAANPTVVLELIAEIRKLSRSRG